MITQVSTLLASNGVTLYFIPLKSAFGEDARLPSLQLPEPHADLFLDPMTRFGDVVQAAGLKSYDFALPQEWIEREYWSKGQSTPRGVWSYDDNKVFGAFVGLPDLLKIIASKLPAPMPRVGEDEITITNG